MCIYMVVQGFFQKIELRGGGGGVKSNALDSWGATFQIQFC